MRKLLAIGLLLVGGFALAEQAAVIGPFGGLNDTDNPLIIGSNQAQALLNVDVGTGGKSIRKRKGFGLSFNTTITTSPIHGVYSFFDASGNDVALAFNDIYLTGSVNGASPTVIFSTGTNGATWQCTDSLGFAYCASSARQPIVKTNGVTYTQLLPMTSIGTMVAATTQRLATAGFASTPSQINLSKANDFATWTTGSGATDAYTETVNAPGSRITHITYACGNLVWFKDASFGMIINPDDQYNAQNVTVSPTIGTLDNSSVYYNGVLHFRAQDGHFYDYDCSSLQKMTRDIENTVGASGQRRANSWTQTSADDFSSGSGFSTYTDTTTTMGSVTLSGISEEFTSTAAWRSSSGTWTVSGGTVTPPTSTTPLESSYLYTSTVPINNAFYLRFRAQELSSDIGGGQKFCAGAQKSSTGQGYFVCVGNNGNLGEGVVTISTFTSAANTTGVLVSSAGAFMWQRPWTTYELKRTATGFMQLWVDDVPCTNAQHTDITGLDRVITFARLDTSSKPKFDSVYLRSSTGTYYSAVHNAPSLSSWDTFTANDQSNDGLIYYYTRSSTTLFTVDSSTPEWTTQTNGAIVSASKGTYFQMMSSFSVTTATQNPTINDFTFNWFEGTASDKVYGTYFDNAIWWAVQKSTGATANDAILRYDLDNQAWTVYDIPANGFYVRGNDLYFGSSTSGRIYKFGDVDSDAGSAINSYWKSKDFFGVDPFTENEYRKLSISAKMVANSSITATYTTNASSATSYTVPLYNASSNFIKNNRYLPAGTVGSYFNVQVGNNAADQNWEVYGIGYTFEPKPWRPGN